MSNLVVLVPAEDQGETVKDCKGVDGSEENVVEENEVNDGRSKDESIMVKENEVNDESNDKKVDEESESPSTNDA